MFGTTDNFNAVFNGALQSCDKNAVIQDFVSIFRQGKDSDREEAAFHLTFNKNHGIGDVSRKYTSLSISPGREREIETRLTHPAKELAWKKSMKLTFQVLRQFYMFATSPVGA